ncbi:DUF3336 domain-containing protein [Erythrobacter sp. KY5]|uniref:DUF3336 domain-containing protein n=1 Tax=Erythrobacter sp. KY5 TaxID=2011159 RepID=UPI0013A68A53|nr:DUF3336 domain-containing protein [Erythrobacter sp. KY5]
MRLDKSSLEKAMKQAESYDQWAGYAKLHDEVTGKDKWRRFEQSERYDFAAIRSRLNELRLLRERADNHELLFALHEGIHGNLGGMGKPSMFSHAKFGTKNLIEDYIEELALALEHLASPAADDIDLNERIEFFHRASDCFGHAAFMMSGSGSLLFFHIGVVKCLLEQDLLPRVISGSSGGAIVSALIGSRTREDALKLLCAEKLFALGDALPSINPEAGSRMLMPPEELDEYINAGIPDLTFDEAMKVSGREISLSIAPAEPRQSSRLLNAITTPNVYLREAAKASAALPGVYPPVVLAAKNVQGMRQPYLPGSRWVDGSLSQDLPAKRLTRLYGVNYFIVSQTNPVAMPFVNTDKGTGTLRSKLFDINLQGFKLASNAWFNILERPLSLASKQLYNMAKTANGVIQQNYTGDINIVPASRVLNPFSALSQPSLDRAAKLILEGERATWPLVERIRTTTRISRLLETIIADLEAERASLGRTRRKQVAASTKARLKAANG